MSVTQSSPETSHLSRPGLLWLRIHHPRSRSSDIVSHRCRGKPVSVHTVATWTKLTVSVSASDGGVELVDFFDAERGVACDMGVCLHQIEHRGQGQSQVLQGASGLEYGKVAFALAWRLQVPKIRPTTRDVRRLIQFHQRVLGVLVSISSGTTPGKKRVGCRWNITRKPDRVWSISIDETETPIRVSTARVKTCTEA